LKNILSFLKLIRWPNLILLALNLCLVKVFLISRANFSIDLLLESDFLKLLLSIILITAAGYIINDYYDVKIDLANKPNRVIIGRQVSRRYGLLWCFSLNTFALVLAFTISKLIFLLFLGSIVLLWWYSTSLKKKPFTGNLVVSFLTALSILILVLYYQKNQLIIGIYAYFAFITSLIREIIKDIEDIDGDKKYGCHTLPINWGIDKTKKFIQILTLSFSISFVIIAYYLELSFGWYWLIFLCSLIVFCVKLNKATTQNDFKTLSMILKIIMLLGVLSMIFVNN
jgi:4-hydroxybenzoate polyprenyltransferase